MDKESNKRFTSKMPHRVEKGEDEKQETEYGKFSRVFLEALKSRDFSEVEGLLAEDVVQILYGNREMNGKDEVISFWKGWLDRWNEPAASTNYAVRLCKYYDREVLSIEPRGQRVLYQMARIEGGKVKQLVLCPNPLQSPMIRHWDLDHSPLLFSDKSVVPDRMGKDLEPQPYRIPCMRCGRTSERLQWHEYKHDGGALGYVGELSVCGHCMEAVEFLPTILVRNT